MISLRSWVGRRVVRILDSSRRLSLRAGRRVIGVALAISLVTTVLACLLGITWKPAGDCACRRADPACGRRFKNGRHAAPAIASSSVDRCSIPTANPCRGAAVYFTHTSTADGPPPPAKAQATTGGDGRFRFTLEKAPFETWGIFNDGDYDNSCQIVAQADGYGPVWQPAFAFEASGELARRIFKAHGDDAEFLGTKREAVLQLVKGDVPLLGHIVDTKGRPVAGVKVEVKVIQRANDDDLTGWLRTAEKKDADGLALFAHVSRKYRQNFIVSDNMLSVEELPAVVPAGTSDADGRFRLTGIGRERLAWLWIEGAGIKTAWQIWARTRPGPTLVVPMTRLRNSEKSTYYGATFEHVVRPSRPIVGTVSDKDTGKPLAGVTIRSNKLSGNPSDNVGLCVHTTSDAAGHYRLLGMPIGEDNALLAEPTKDQPYLRSKRRADTTAGKELLSLDFALKRGVWIRGRITDARSGARFRAAA